MAKENKLRYTLTLSGVGVPKGVLCVTVQPYGRADERKSVRVRNLKDPDYRYWDNQLKRFSSGTFTAQDNNPVLDELCEFCDRLLDNESVTTPTEFAEALRTGIPPKPRNFGAFVQSLVDEMRNGKNNKRPSRNYQVYLNLLHKLQREGNIIKVPLDEICNKHFIQFGEFILSLDDKKGRNNYLNIMKVFKQAHTKAYNRELNNNVLRFKYADNAPLKEDTEKRPSLTLEQYNQFCRLDLSTITLHGMKTDFYKSLYRDFCIFLYETKMRPVDVLRSKVANILNINGKQYLRYVPEKKKNFSPSSKDKIVHSPLSATALGIIEKYKGQSTQGYIFPFSMNNYDWDFLNADSWNNWNIRKQRALEMINKWLKKVQVVLGVGFTLTLYTFRHSALTHACMADGANWGKIALDAGTSIKMLEKHYVTNVV
jgi:integrase